MAAKPLAKPAKPAAPSPDPDPGLPPATGWDDEEDDDAVAPPETLRDEGPLESLGKAVTSPVTGAAEADEATADEAAGRAERGKPPPG